MRVLTVMDAKEWRGKESPRNVELHLTSNGTLEVFTTMGSHLRSIKLSCMSAVNVKLGANKKRNTMLIHVPQEYDLVSDRCLWDLVSEWCLWDLVSARWFW